MSTPPPVWPPQPGSPSPFDRPPPRKSNPLLIVLLVILLCVAMAGAYWAIKTNGMHHAAPVRVY